MLRELAAASPAVTVLHLSRRFGHQMSLIAGIDHASGDAVIMMDCNMQHPPEVIPELLRPVRRRVRCRAHSTPAPNRSVGFVKRLTSRLFYDLQNTLSPVEIKEGAADFRLISGPGGRQGLPQVDPRAEPVPARAVPVGRLPARGSVVRQPVAQKAGTTKYRPFRLFAFAITGIISFSKVPLRIATLTGFAMAMLSAVYGAWLLMMFLVGGYFPPGFASLILVVLVTSGMQLMFLGIVGEYLGASSTR